MNKPLILSVVICTLLTGCNLSPDYDVPTVKVNDLYLNAQVDGVNQQAVQLDHWWKQFNDPQLNALVDKTLQQNITLKIASERVKSAQAYEKAISSQKVPTIALSGGYVDVRLSENDPLLGDAVGGIDLSNFGLSDQVKLLERDTNTNILGLTAAWEVDLFGRVDALSKAAKIRVEQAELIRTNLNTLMVAEMINNYLQFRGAQERIAIAQKNIDEQSQMLKIVESLNRNGYGSSLDVANAKASLAATKSALPKLDTAKHVHLNRIAILLGEPVTEVATQFNDEPLPKMDGLIPTGIPSELLTRRFDIAIAEREMAARNQQVGAAISAKYPQFFLTGTPGLSSDHFEDIFDSESTTWALGAGFKWNVFDGGRTQAMVDLQTAGFQESVYSYQQTVNNAINEVETVLKTYGNNQKYHSLILEADEQAEVAVDKATSLYQSGLENHLSVLNAQKFKNSIQDTEVVARLDTASTVVMLHKALGGDWGLNPTPVKSED